MAYGEWAREVGKAASNHNRAACLCPQAIAEGLTRSETCRMIYFGTSAFAAIGADLAEWPVSRRLPTLRRYASCTRVECYKLWLQFWRVRDEIAPHHGRGIDDSYQASDEDA